MIAVTVVALGLFGVYRGAWQYAGIFDVYRIVGALTVSAGLLLAYGEWRVPTLAHSHSIVYVDALLAMALLLASRLSFKSLGTLRQRLQLRGDRERVYGAADVRGAEPTDLGGERERSRGGTGGGGSRGGGAGRRGADGSAGGGVSGARADYHSCRTHHYQLGTTASRTGACWGLSGRWSEPGGRVS